jgi:S-adenosylmethionine:tRNA ribosyltransferase-isomerase
MQKNKQRRYQLSDFKFHIPENLIAQYPLKKRDHSKLMIVDKLNGKKEHASFQNIIDYLQAGDALIINETKVFPARLLGEKEKTGGKVELLLNQAVDKRKWQVLAKPGRKIHMGNKLIFSNELECEVLAATETGEKIVQFNCAGSEFFKKLENIGYSPLPPYIKRKAIDADKNTYQTIFAQKRGAVAAPTAGLHFTQELMENIKKKEIKIIPILLHVGLGTFRPVSDEKFQNHKMHSEYYEISENAAQKINAIKKEGGRIIAVGTTSVRTLESVANENGFVEKKSGWTDIYIYPPYPFKVVDGLITNFHLSGSTLFMLVSAFAGLENMRAAYKSAVENKYRFFSYGDAMLII